MDKQPFFGTFWRPSLIKVHSREAPDYEFYAVVKAIGYVDELGGKSGTTILKGWRLEYRVNSIYHPAFGLIPKETCKDYNMFVEQSQNGKRLDFEFHWPSSDVQLIGTEIEKVINAFENKML